MTGGSLRLRLLVTGALAVVIALALSALGLSLLFERHSERRIVAELAFDIDQIVAGLDREGESPLDVVRPPADPRFETPLSGLYWQVIAGETVLRSRSLWDEVLEPPPEPALAGDLRSSRLDGPGDSALLAAERTIVLPTRLGGQSARVIVAIDRVELTAATADFRRDLLPYLFLVGALLLAAGFTQVIVGLQPLRSIRNRLAEIKSGRSQRLGQDGFPSEVQPLAAEVDALLDASDAAIARARARASDLAHGLKTPLQVLAGDVERLRKRGVAEIADDIEAVADALKWVVEHELARSRIAQTGAGKPGDVAETLDRILGVLRRTPDASRVSWNVDIPPGTLVRVGSDVLAEALGNLLENAARHATSAIGIAASRSGTVVTITIKDDGGGIGDDRLAEVTRRGVRYDERGSGAGLGLAIVAEIAEAAGGRLDLANEDGGLVARLLLPGALAQFEPVK